MSSLKTNSSSSNAVVLSFRKEELERVKQALLFFPQQPLHEFETVRCRVQDCTVILFRSGKLLIQGKGATAVRGDLLARFNFASEIVLGIDEAGRGERTGPFCIAAVLGDQSALREVRDSKKTADLKKARFIVEQHALASAEICFSPAQVDSFRGAGVNLNVLEAKGIDALIDFFERAGWSWSRIVVDGSPLPVKKKGIVFLPKADDLEPVVSAASILARTERDAFLDQTERKSWKKKTG